MRGFGFRRVFRRGFPLGVYRYLRERLLQPYVHFLLRRASRARGSAFTVVQIGAKDGIHTDPISSLVRELGWAGVLVEPNPHNFLLLQEHYRAFPQIKLENAAIAAEDGTVQLYRPKELLDGSHNPLKGKDSLHPESFSKYSWMAENWADLVEPIEVPALCLDSLFEKYSLREIHFFVCDTEGHDKVILDQLDLSRFAPSFIQFEFVHLGSQEVATLVQRLRSHGYRVLYLRWDIFAYHTKA